MPYCTLCERVLPNEAMRVIYQTAFFRMGEIEHPLGICESCAKEHPHVVQVVMKKNRHESTPSADEES